MEDDIRVDAMMPHAKNAIKIGMDYVILRSLLMPNARNFQLERVVWNAQRHCCDVIYTKPKFQDGPESFLAETIARTLAVRSRRMHPETGRVTPPIDEWWRVMRLEFKPLFNNCSPGRHVGAGWVDLTLALADWLYDGESILRMDDFASRDGELVAEVSGYDDSQFKIVSAFETLSTRICETCGAPGKSWPGDALRPAITACGLHSRAGENG